MALQNRFDRVIYIFEYGYVTSYSKCIFEYQIKTDSANGDLRQLPRLNKKKGVT